MDAERKKNMHLHRQRDKHTSALLVRDMERQRGRKGKMEEARGRFGMERDMPRTT